MNKLKEAMAAIGVDCHDAEKNPITLQLHSVFYEHYAKMLSEINKGKPSETAAIPLPTHGFIHNYAVGHAFMLKEWDNKRNKLLCIAGDVSSVNETTITFLFWHSDLLSWCKLMIEKYGRAANE